jgi:hypothetical protein
MGIVSESRDCLSLSTLRALRLLKMGSTKGAAYEKTQSPVWGDVSQRTREMKNGGSIAGRCAEAMVSAEQLQSAECVDWQRRCRTADVIADLTQVFNSLIPD